MSRIACREGVTYVCIAIHAHAHMYISYNYECHLLSNITTKVGIVCNAYGLVIMRIIKTVEGDYTKDNLIAKSGITTQTELI